jgi:hypothetical protein
VIGESLASRETISPSNRAGQCDRSAGFNTRGKGRLNSQIQIKTRQAQPVCARISGEQHIGEHRMRRSRCHGSTDQLKGCIQFRLGTDHFHRAAGSNALGE